MPILFFKSLVLPGKVKGGLTYHTFFLYFHAYKGQHRIGAFSLLAAQNAWEVRFIRAVRVIMVIRIT